MNKNGCHGKSSKVHGCSPCLPTWMHSMKNSKSAIIMLFHLDVTFEKKVRNKEVFIPTSDTPEHSCINRKYPVPFWHRVVIACLIEWLTDWLIVRLIDSLTDWLDIKLVDWLIPTTTGHVSFTCGKPFGRRSVYQIMEHLFLGSIYTNHVTVIRNLPVGIQGVPQGVICIWI